MQDLRLALRILTPEERRKAGWLLLVVILTTLFDVVGVASIMPFLAVMANPDIAQKQALIAFVQVALNLEDTDSLLYVLGLMSFLVLVFSGVVRITGQYVINRFTQMRAHSISVRLFDAFMRHGYEFHLHKHSGEISKSVLDEAGQLVSKIYTPASQLIAQCVVIIMLSALLIAVDPIIALTVTAVFAVLYGSFYWLVRGRLMRMGEERLASNVERYRSVGEALGGIKLVKLLGREAAYVDRFSKASERMARHQSASTTISNLPKFIVESVGFGGIILLALVLMAKHGGHEAGALSNVLPLLGLYAFVGYRMLPAVQQAYSAATTLRGGSAALHSVYSALEASAHLKPLKREEVGPMALREAISLEDVTFWYQGAGRPSISDVAISIPAGATVGIVGCSGAGKTTLVDLILGLLEPRSGQIRIDGRRIDEGNIRSWQATVGYVPQDIFLVDGTVWENVALGLSLDKIDKAKVRECARMAQALDFIEGTLPQGFDTSIGERGMRVSGGQRQRIGIARALYRDPPVIIFDEATSALDNLTEREVMESIGILRGSKTVLIVAHRMQTIKQCEMLLFMREGRVASVGTYETLYADDAEFRQLVTGVYAG